MPGFPPTCVCVCQDPPVAPAPPPQELPLPLPVCQDDPVDPVCNEKISNNNKIENDVCESEFEEKPVPSDQLEMDKTKVLKTNDSLMEVESIIKCFKRAFCNTFDLH